MNDEFHSEVERAHPTQPRQRVRECVCCQAFMIIVDPGLNPPLRHDPGCSAAEPRDSDAGDALEWLERLGKLNQGDSTCES